VQLHDDPNQAAWDRRIIEEAGQHYVYSDVFDWRNMHTVIDVGAHIGAFTVWLKAINPAVQIAAVEADPENYGLLQQNVGNLPDVRALLGAVHYGEVPLMLQRFREPDNAGSHTLMPLCDGGQPYDGALLDLVVIEDQMCWGLVDAIKLDCEGSEYSILAHADIGLLCGCMVIVGEYHDGPERFRHECIARLAPWFDTVYLSTTAPLGMFCLVRKGSAVCG